MRSRNSLRNRRESAKRLALVFKSRRSDQHFVDLPLPFPENACARLECLSFFSLPCSLRFGIAHRFSKSALALRVESAVRALLNAVRKDGQDERPAQTRGRRPTEVFLPKFEKFLPADCRQPADDLSCCRDSLVHAAALSTATPVTLCSGKQSSRMERGHLSARDKSTAGLGEA